MNGPGTRARLGRRTALVVAAVAVSAGLTGCGAPAPPAAPAAPATAAGPATGTFIGDAGPETLIAVVVGAGGDARALLYGPAPSNPDGTARTFDELTAEWFDAVALTGDRLEGSSAGGFTLTATLAADAVRGTVAGPGLQPQPFVATPATGTAGLYDVSYNPADHSIDGSSATGGRLTGTAPAGEATKSTEVTLTVTPATGAPAVYPVAFFPGGNPEVVQLGFIVSQDGEVRGGPRTLASKSRSGGSGGQFTCPIID